MALRDLGQALGDIAQAGVVITRKLVARSFADERELDTETTSALVDGLHPTRCAARVADINEETPTTRTLRLVPEDGQFPPFRAGQFFNLFCKVGRVRTSRPYSISSPPSRRGHLDVTVRKVESGFVSPYLREKVKVGNSFELAGPGGSFYHEALVDSREVVFLAGGSGITPFMSIIREVFERNLDLKMHLLYGCRVPDDIIFGDELADLACMESKLKVDIVISEPPGGYEGACGFLDAEMIRSLIGAPKDRTFYICGPHAMYGLCEAALAELGISARRVKRELSGPLPDVTLVDGWPKKVKRDAEFKVRIAGTRKTFKAVSSEPLMNSMERAGLATEALCRSGECGVCRTRLVDGDVFMPASVAVRKADVAFGYIHPCMSYPVSDITVSL